MSDDPACPGPTRIALVGGAASAVCLLDALAQSGVTACEVTVYEPSPRLWRGRAYQQDSPVVLTNAPADDMSVRDGDSDHFVRWVAARGNDTDPTSFMPRAVFGDYLEDTAERAIATLRRKGWLVCTVRDAVRSASRHGRQVVLHTDGGSRAVFDAVVLSVGTGQPEDVFGLAGHPRYIGDPYPTELTTDGLSPDEDVAVIGTGLTAVDVVRALAAREHRGRIHLLSRLGILPAIRQRRIVHELTAFTPGGLHERAGDALQVELSDVVDLLGKELASADADVEELFREIAAACREPAVERLRRQFRDVDSDHVGLRIVQMAVPECGPDLWPLLSDEMRTVVLGSYHRVLMSLCCPMPPDSAAVLLRLIDDGRLDVRSGLRAITPMDQGDNAGFRIETATGVLHTDRVVNAVSAPAHRIPPSARDLVDSLCEQGLGVRHPQGGLHVHTRNSRLVGAPDAAPVYAVGDLAGGTFFFTFGVPSLVDRCRDVVADLLRPVTASGQSAHAATAVPAQRDSPGHTTISMEAATMTDTVPAHLADTATGLPIPDRPVLPVAEERQERKRRLAAAIRLFGRAGFGEGISGHISVRDPGDTTLFWVNPFGISFRRVRVSDLICVGTDGRVVTGKHKVNPSAFAIHSEIHQFSPDAEAVAHGHTVHSRSLGALGRLLEPVDQESAAFYGNQVLHDGYDGPAVTVEQGRAVAERLHGNTAILLRHHGLITCGASLEEAVHWFFTFDGCAEVQLKAAAAGPLQLMTDAQATSGRDGFGDRQLAQFSFELMWEEIVHEQPDFLDE